MEYRLIGKKYGCGFGNFSVLIFGSFSNSVCSEWRVLTLSPATCTIKRKGVKKKTFT